METKSCEKVAKIYNCFLCDYSTCRKSSLDKHIQTDKHKNMLNGDIGDVKVVNKSQIQYNCSICKKQYNSRNGLWKHRKICNNKILESTEILEDDNKLISLILDVVKSNTELQKQNQDFQQQIIQMCKDGINNNSIINNSTVNSHNKTFNLQVFLNEQCKDAMNIMDFVDSIKLDLNDLESVGKLGYINGISNIIIKKLNALDVHMRPVHCTDLKRETMYVKSQNMWEKEDEENKNIRRAIKHIAFKNIKNLELFKELHPDCLEYDSKHGDHYLKLQIEALGGGSSNVEYDSQTKIIKKIAKEVTIDKTPN
jgi:hypothetical protein